MICPGTQNALYNLLITLTSPGDVLLTEALTYPGMKAAAACAGVRLVGVEMDEAGIVPDALRAACRQHAPKAAYLVPTIHNPTTATMPQSRREEVAEQFFAAATSFWSRTMLTECSTRKSCRSPRSFSERTYYVASFSKCIAPRIARVISRDA